MNLSDELRKLQALYESGALTAAEFAQAKQTVLAKHSDHNDLEQANLQAKLEAVELQNQLLQLEQNWQIDREKYMIRGKNGKYLPTKSGSIIRAVSMGIVDLMITFILMANGAEVLGIGFLFTFGAIAILTSANEYQKADEYDRAHRSYQNQRDRLIQQQHRRFR